MVIKLLLLLINTFPFKAVFKQEQEVYEILIKYEERDISAILYQKCLILCSNTLLVVFHNMSETILLPWQHTGYQTPDTKSFSGQFWPSVLIFANDASKDEFILSNIEMGLVDVLAWFHFSELKITKILKTDWWGLEKSELPW